MFLPRGSPPAFITPQGVQAALPLMDVYLGASHLQSPERTGQLLTAL